MLPNLVIIGAMKAGTSSLHYYLSLHPEISMSHIKELHFFTSDKMGGNWSKGIEWYESNFKQFITKIRGESSTTYAWHPTFKDIPERMYTLVPDTKLVYILRDPIERIISQYVHNVSAGRETRDVSKAVLENRNYIFVSSYYMQLEQYLKYYPGSNILIITLEELTKNTYQVLKRVFGFLGVDDSFYSSEFSTVHNKSSDKTRKNWLGLLVSRIQGKDNRNLVIPKKVERALEPLMLSMVKKPFLKDNIRQELISILKDDIDRLKKYTGNEFKEWNI